MRKAQKETQFLPYAALRGFEKLVEQSFDSSAKETRYSKEKIETTLENQIPVRESIPKKRQ